LATAVQDLAAGRDHSLVLRSDASLQGWGGDGTGRFPPPAGICTAPPTAQAAVVVRAAQPLQQISASGGTSLGLDAQGTAYLWGANRAGMGGELAHLVHERPQPLRGLPPLAQLRSGEFFALALARDGRVFGWGLASHGGKVRNRAPAPMAGLPAIMQCDVGGAHALALDRSRRLWAWGSNAAGQLGLGHLQDQSQPSRIHLAADVVGAAAGASHSLAIDDQGAVWGWGSNQHGQLGSRQGAFRDAPLRISLPERITQVAAGMYVSYALGRSGRLYAWGWNARGQLGQGDLKPHAAILTVPLPARVRQIVTGQAHALATDGDQVWAWGDNTSGQLGREGGPSGTPRPLPMTSAALSIATSISKSKT
jgi:alpha-tubulin suppressor-like RCC1 family protein